MLLQTVPEYEQLDLGDIRDISRERSWNGPSMKRLKDLQWAEMVKSNTKDF